MDKLQELFDQYNALERELAAAKSERDDLAKELHRVNALCNQMRMERDEALAWLKEELGIDHDYVLTGTSRAFISRLEVKP